MEQKSKNLIKAVKNLKNEKKIDAKIEKKCVDALSEFCKKKIYSNVNTFANNLRVVLNSLKTVRNDTDWFFRFAACAVVHEDNVEFLTNVINMSEDYKPEKRRLLFNAYDLGYYWYKKNMGEEIKNWMEYMRQKKKKYIDSLHSCLENISKVLKMDVWHTPQRQTIWVDSVKAMMLIEEWQNFKGQEYIGDYNNLKKIARRNDRIEADDDLSVLCDLFKQYETYDLKKEGLCPENNKNSQENIFMFSNIINTLGRYKTQSELTFPTIEDLNKK